MDRGSPGHHLNPPLPQRRSSSHANRLRRSVQTSLTSTKNNRNASDSHSTLTFPATDSLDRSQLNVHRPSPTFPRAINNDYRDIPPTSSKLPERLQSQSVQTNVENRRNVASHDVIVELSVNGQPKSRTTPIVGVDTGFGTGGLRSKTDEITAVDRTSKPVDNENDDSVPTQQSQCSESIICPSCGKCRCAECARSTSLICCRADSDSSTSCCERAVDAVTCMYCVRSLCWNDGNEDDPSASLPAGRCRRWTLLVALSTCLPCLCFYLPLHCLARSSCVGSRRGCRCRSSTALPVTIDWPYQSKSTQLPLSSKDAGRSTGTTTPPSLGEKN